MDLLNYNNIYCSVLGYFLENNTIQNLDVFVSLWMIYFSFSSQSNRETAILIVKERSRYLKLCFSPGI